VKERKGCQKKRGLELQISGGKKEYRWLVAN
jgi:hypothetical protein